jgi:hypothetical protein
MTTLNLILALTFLFSASLAASAAGDNAVLLSVTKVTVPEKLPGACDVSGTVSRVFQGSAFHAGQGISVKVPCDSGAPRLSPAVAVISGPDNVHYIAAPIRKQSKQGFARLDDSGALIWRPSNRSFGHYGAAWGYRVVDGLEMPAD